MELHYDEACKACPQQGEPVLAEVLSKRLEEGHCRIATTIRPKMVPMMAADREFTTGELLNGVRWS
jgi:hypothetical protein